MGAERAMLAALLHASADLHYERVQVPVFGDDEVLVHIRAAGISSSPRGATTGYATRTAISDRAGTAPPGLDATSLN